MTIFYLGIMKNCFLLLIKMHPVRIGNLTYGASSKFCHPLSSRENKLSYYYYFLGLAEYLKPVLGFLPLGVLLGLNLLLLILKLS
jgi:hypothetical protein